METLAFFSGRLEPMCLQLQPLHEEKPPFYLLVTWKSYMPLAARMGKSVSTVCRRRNFVCFFVNKRIKDKLPFARWANYKRVKGNRLGFRFPFDVFLLMSSCPCLHVSMSPCLRVSMSPCLLVSLSPCLSVLMSLCLYNKSLCFYVSMSLCPCLDVSMFLEFRKRKAELTGNGNLCLCAANGNDILPFVVENGKRKFVFLGRQTINGNRRSLFQKRAHLCSSMTVVILYSHSV